MPGPSWNDALCTLKTVPVGSLAAANGPRLRAPIASQNRPRPPRCLVRRPAACGYNETLPSAVHTRGSRRAMYEQFYSLSAPPFSITPDPRYLFFSRRHREAFEHMLYGITQRKGFIQITGEVGAGKSTLCRAILEELGPGYAPDPAPALDPARARPPRHRQRPPPPHPPPQRVPPRPPPGWPGRRAVRGRCLL